MICWLASRYKTLNIDQCDSVHFASVTLQMLQFFKHMTTKKTTLSLFYFKCLPDRLHRTLGCHLAYFPFLLLFHWAMLCVSYPSTQYTAFLDPPPVILGPSIAIPLQWSHTLSCTIYLPLEGIGRENKRGEITLNECSPSASPTLGHSKAQSAVSPSNQVCLSAKGVYWKHPLYDYVFIFCCYRNETGPHLTSTDRKLILKMIAHTLTRPSELSANKEGSPARPCQCCSFQCYFGSREGRVKICSLKPYCLCTQLNSIPAWKL